MCRCQLALDVWRRSCSEPPSVSPPRQCMVSRVPANAKTWWLESAARNDRVRITFLFGNADAAPPSSAPELALETPDHVKISATSSNDR